jgi:hypothetical protein
MALLHLLVAKVDFHQIVQRLFDLIAVVQKLLD